VEGFAEGPGRGAGGVPEGACLRCGGPLQSYGEQEFRTGGTTGGWKLLFGELAELGEEKVRFELLACHQCGHVELRLPRRP
jgi:hypothetical protein